MCHKKIKVSILKNKSYFCSFLNNKKLSQNAKSFSQMDVVTSFFSLCYFFSFLTLPFPVNFLTITSVL